MDDTIKCNNINVKFIDFKNKYKKQIQRLDILKDDKFTNIIISREFKRDRKLIIINDSILLGYIILDSYRNDKQFKRINIKIEIDFSILDNQNIYEIIENIMNMILIRYKDYFNVTVTINDGLDLPIHTEYYKINHIGNIYDMVTYHHINNIDHLKKRILKK